MTIPARLPDLPNPCTPGAYLERRRIAEGLSRRDVSLVYVDHIESARIAELTIGEFEADRRIAPLAALLRLRKAFKFDAHIYCALAEDLPIPTLCRRCGCSWQDPCDDEERGPCGWSADPTLCTHCEDPR